MPSQRNAVVVDAPSNLGLRPPSPDTVPGCWRLPEVLRREGIVARLGATDGGRGRVCCRLRRWRTFPIWPWVCVG
jgi:hypothetical protein